MTEDDAESAARADRMNRNSAASEDLVAANNESNKTMLALVEHVRQETVARDRKIAVMERSQRQVRKLVYLICAATAILLVIAGINAYNIAASKDQQRQIRNINATLLDCVNQTGECGQINAQTQGQVLDEVKRYNLAGFYCIRNNPAASDPKAEKFLKCMERIYPGGPTLARR